MSDSPTREPDERDDPPSSDAPEGSKEAAHDLPPRWADRKRGMDPENRRRVIDACAVRTADGWSTHFVLMMVLSLLVAIMGLSAGSAALVIGAMLLAPLMQPVLGTAASLTMALGGPLKRSLLVLVMASVGSIALAYVVATFLRDGPLSGEILSRTSPDARDLVVALAAGAAGSYATTRSDLSSSLPGVAIAVALVPPLGVVGMTLEAGRGDLARGALLLYLTNLAAIVVAGIVVFVLTGFVPPRRLATTSTQVFLGGLLALVFMLVVAIPLTVASSRAADDARERVQVQEAVDAWLSGTGDEVDEIDIDGTEVTVRILGFGQPRPTEDLERSVQQTLGSGAEVVVQWTQALLAPERSPGPSDRELLEADVAAVVDQWLEAEGGQGFDISRFEVTESRVRIDITSTRPPPGVEALRDRLDAALGITPELEVTWTPQTRLLPDEAEESAIDEVRSRVRRTALDWAVTAENIQVAAVDFDGERVVVDLVGPEAPAVAQLEDLLRAQVDDEVAVTVWFTQRQILVPAPTPTPTPTPTATPVPTPTPTPEPTPTPGFVLEFATPTPTTEG